MKCKLHGVQLIEATAYRPAADWTPSIEHVIITNKYPNSVHPNYSLWKDQLYTVPELLTYCPKCDRAARQEKIMRDE